MIARARERHPGFTFHTAHAAEFKSDEKFDYIIASDLINDAEDVQLLLENLRGCTHSKSRLVLNFFNNLWRPVLSVAEKLGAKSPTLTQSWLSLADVKNLLHLAGLEVVKTDTRILWPVYTPLLSTVMNRFLAPLLKHFCLTIFIVARPRPQVPPDHQDKCSVVIPARNEAGNIAGGRRCARRTWGRGHETHLRRRPFARTTPGRKSSASPPNIPRAQHQNPPANRQGQGRRRARGVRRRHRRHLS